MAGLGPGGRGGQNEPVNEFVVQLDPEYAADKARRTARWRRIGGTALIAVGVLMAIASILGGASTLSQPKAIYAWIVSAALGILSVWVGWGQITSGKTLIENVTATEVFTILPQGISIPFPGQRVPVLERAWGKFSFTLGEALGKPVLHFTSENGPKGDFQLTQMDKTADEIDAALRRFSRGKQRIEGLSRS